MEVWWCLLLAAAGCCGCCRATLPLISPAALEELSADPARCVLSTLAPSLLRAPGQRLLVVCNAHWCDGRFLGRLGVQKVVLAGEGLSVWTESRALQLTPSNVSMLLVATDSLEQLREVGPLLSVVMPQTRALLWTSTRATVTQTDLGDVVESVLNLTTTVPLGNVRLGVDTAKSTRLFAWTRSVMGDAGSLAHVDTWAPRVGRWSRGAALFPEPCTSWRPPAPGEPLTFLFHFHRIPDYRVNERIVKAHDVVLEFLRRTAGLVFKREAETLAEGSHLTRNLMTCRSDLLAFVTILESRMLETIDVSTWNLEELVVVLPAGAGRGRSPLHRLVVFSVSLWCATGVAVLVVVAVLCAPRPRGLVRAALQTVAPLLAQPPPFACNQYQRLLLASWLAASVVLAAAYQGQVLSRLTVPDAADEINSMEELAASGLAVYTRGDFRHLDLQLPNNTIVHNDFFGLIIDALLERRERVAIVVTELVAKHLVQHTRGPGRALHAFPVPGVRLLRSRFSTSRGSPVERPLRAAVGRMHAAGIYQHIDGEVGPLGCRDPAPPEEASPRALALGDVLPPFLVLAAGLLLAALAFLCELARPRLS
ncbi:Ionotropic receptor 238 [Frankliniella occidentalis]|nr:Ionotropic receptor 238 [Frankliniella occidentalis]